MSWLQAGVWLAAIILSFGLSPAAGRRGDDWLDGNLLGVGFGAGVVLLLWMFFP